MRVPRSALLLLCGILSATGVRAEGSAHIAARRAALALDQRSETFALELRQSQQKLFVSGDDRSRLDELHLDQRHRQEALHERQLGGVAASGAASSRGEPSLLEAERSGQRFFFETQSPAWGPRLDVWKGWTPTVERFRRPWTPTLE